jgi:tetratricopeptide (TPR) repeat protein
LAVTRRFILETLPRSLFAPPGLAAFAAGLMAAVCVPNPVWATPIQPPGIPRQWVTSTPGVIDLLENLPGSAPARMHLAAAREYLAQERLLFAVWQLEAAAGLATDASTSLRIRTALGILYNRTGQHREAAEIGNDLIEEIPNDKRAYDIVGLAYLGMGHPEPAIEAYRRMVTVAPHDASGYVYLADALVSNNELDEASKVYAQALEIDRKFLEARLKKAATLLRMGMVDAAIEHASEALTQNPDHPLANAILGDAYTARGNLGRAEISYREAIRVNPDLLAVYESLADLYAQRKQREQAIDTYLALLSRDPDYLPAHEALSKLYKASDQHSLSEYRLGVVAAARKKTDAAIQHHRSAIRHDPSLTEAYVELVEIYVGRGQIARAEDLVKELVARGQDDAAAHTLLAGIRSSDNRQQESEAELRMALKANPGYLPALLSLGSLLGSSGRCAEAVPLLEAALAASTGALGTYLQLGDCQQDLREWRKAAASFQHALRLAPRNPRALNGLAWSHAARGENLSKAIFLAEKAAELSPGDAAILDTLGWCYFLTGRYVDAVLRLESAAHLLPREPTIQYHLGVAHHAQGGLPQAKTHLTQALAINPSFPEAAEAQAILRQIETSPDG